MCALEKEAPLRATAKQILSVYRNELRQFYKRLPFMESCSGNWRGAGSALQAAVDAGDE